MQLMDQLAEVSSLPVLRHHTNKMTTLKRFDRVMPHAKPAKLPVNRADAVCQQDHIALSCNDTP